MDLSILNKSFIGAKPLCIRFDKVNGFIRVYSGTRYFTLFEFGKYCAIFNRIRYLILGKCGITYSISHNQEKIKVDLYDPMYLETTLRFHNTWNVIT